jgi:hypothetical protein
LQAITLGQERELQIQKESAIKNRISFARAAIILFRNLPFNERAPTFSFCKIGT